MEQVFVPSKKGVSFVAARDYVIQLHGRRAWDDVLKRLRPEDVEVVAGAIGMGWYALECYARLVRAIDGVVGVGDLREVWKLARFEAERDVPRIYRVLLRMVRPSYTIERMAELWTRYHNTGRLDVRRTGPDQLEASIVEWTDDAALCTGFAGYATRLLELAGATDVRVEHVACRSRSPAPCRWRASWGEAGR